jgi:Ser/Thr protein kinase RdoA (MazF antagonist)
MLVSIALQFSPDINHIHPLGNGLINDTYLVTTSTMQFVLQRLNHKVFPCPEQVIENHQQLKQHIKHRSLALQLPELIKTRAGKSFYIDEQGNFWRSLSFIANSKTLETVASKSDARQIGFALGVFHQLFSDLDSDSLYDILPDFHVTPEYLKQYNKLLGQNNNQAEHRYCAEFIEKFRHQADELESAKQQSLLTMRVIHGDPKLDNFLFTKKTNEILGIIDLDTVKPGLVHYDIGDCIRSCCHTLDTDQFNAEICAEILKAYLLEAQSFFTDADFYYLYAAIRLIPFELGLRFYSDYLQGNCYFKVSYEQQNLQRAISQFKLCESIIAHESAIRYVLEKLPCQITKKSGNANF